MGKITNTGKVGRGINIRGTDDVHGQIMVRPGETVDVDLFDPGNPVYHGLHKSGEMDFGDALIDPSAAADYHRAKDNEARKRRDAEADAAKAKTEAEIEAEVQRRVAAAQAEAETSKAKK